MPDNTPDESQLSPQPGTQHQTTTITQREVDRQLVDIIYRYSEGLQKEMSKLVLWVVVLTLCLLAGEAWRTWRMQESIARMEINTKEANSRIEAQVQHTAQIVERMDKRHWELSKVIDLSQSRSRKSEKVEKHAKTETDLP